MASGPNTSWEIDGETVETVSDFFGGGLQNHCRWWLQPWNYLLLGRKVMTNLDSIFKSRDITLPTKVRLVKAMVFLVVMYGCESWTVKKAKELMLLIVQNCPDCACGWLQFPCSLPVSLCSFAQGDICPGASPAVKGLRSQSVSCAVCSDTSVMSYFLWRYGP